MKGILLASLCLLFFLTGYSQDPEISHKQFQSVIPQSPNAASLGRYTESPVSTYTGIPSITVPLYEINTGKLKLPITLSYHGGGIKVEEIASWAGLGWSLSPGGQVSRQVRGVPDESAYGYLTQYRKIYEYATMNYVQRRNYLRDVLQYDHDPEPDMFSYSAGGMSGEFFFDTTGNVITIPASKVFISGLNGFVIADKDGTIYHFSVPETTSSSSLANNSLSSGGASAGVSAWLLSKIESADGKDSITFEYDMYVSTFTSFSSQTKYYFINGDALCSAKPGVTYTSYNEVLGYRLAKIKFRNGEVEFNATGDDRLDVPGEQALESVVIHSDNNKFYKKYNLHQHYAASSGAPGTYSSSYKEYYRLMLDSVTVHDTGTDILQTYSFEYNGGLPQRMSFSQDYWGYYNGASNSEFVPDTYVQGLFGRVFIPGANRGANEIASQGAMLNKITYPTGGYTTFTYEANRVLTGTPLPGDEPISFVSIGSTLYGGPIFTSDTFRIGACEAIEITFNDNGCGGGVQSLECPLVNIIDETSYQSIPVTASGIGYLTPGHLYHIEADLSGVIDQDVYDNFYVTLLWKTCLPVQVNGFVGYNTQVGGNRIKQINTYDPVGNITETKSYDYNYPGTSYTSGFMTTPVPEFVSDMDAYTSNGHCIHRAISSASNYPLLSTHGSTAGYSFVREIFGTDSANGIKEYSYAILPDGVNPNFPFPPAISYEWARGYPLYERTLKAQVSGGVKTFVPVSKKTYEYTTYQAISREGLKVGVALHDNSGITGPGERDTALNYTILTAFFVPIHDTTIVYGTAGTADSMITTNTYEYSMNSLETNEVQTEGSNKKTIITKTKYPGDYTLDNYDTNPLCVTIRDLSGAKPTIPVETYTISKNDTGAEFVTGGVILQFYPDILLPEKIFILKTAEPIPINSFTVSYIDTTGAGTFVKDSRYKEEVLFNGYDSATNLKGQQRKNNVQLSYLYDYKKSLPVAQAMDAPQEDIAYTSFEADGTGGWTLSGTPTSDATAPTGSKSYTLTYSNITKTISSAKTYIVSFWKYGSVTMSAGSLYRTGRTVNGWTYVEYELSSTSSFNITGTGKIDELRLYPKHAQMTTYTYEPLLGLTSQSDANGNIAYYEYDFLGRLKFIKDMDRNIVKAMDYQYQKPVTQ